MQHEKFHYADLASLEAELLRLGVHLPLSTDLSVLKTPVQAGKLALANRLAVQPMEGCDGTPEGSPGELTLRRYDRFAESGDPNDAPSPLVIDKVIKGEYGRKTGKGWYDYSDSKK